VAAYSQFLGCRVKVQYRVGDILLPASGTFVGDTGRSVFLEQHLEQRGKRSYFRWEIPYPYIHSIEKIAEPVTEGTPALPGSALPKAAAAAVGESSSASGSILPLPPGTKTA
jgi:hypothetical protein